MTWSLWGVPGILSTLVAWGAAFLVFRTDPSRTVNRRLAALLLLEGLWLTGSVGVLFFLESAPTVHAVAVVGTAALAALPFVYLAFLGTALDTPLVRPLRSEGAFGLLVLLAVAAGAAVLLRPDAFVSAPYEAGWAPWNYRLEGLGQSLVQLQGAVHLYGLLAAVSAYLQPHCCRSLRRRAFWVAVAFGTRDVYLGLTQLLYPVLRPVTFWGDLVYNPALGLVFLVYVALLSYGVLQAQIFDIDLRIRAALRRSTVAASIAGAFFVGSELLEAVIPVDGTMLGILTAGLIVLLLRPLQRMAERLARRAMPGVEPTPDYLEARKHEVYRAAVEGALQDGTITDREEAVLARLRSELEIGEDEAGRILETTEERLFSPHDAPSTSKEAVPRR